VVLNFQRMVHGQCEEPARADFLRQQHAGVIDTARKKTAQWLFVVPELASEETRYDFDDASASVSRWRKLNGMNATVRH